MNKKSLFYVLAVIIALAGIFFVVLGGKNRPEGSQLTLYYGKDCPHCANVEEFIKENKIDEKVTLKRKEVSENIANAKELQEKAQICGLPTSEIGVPFLWDGSDCMVGDTDIINFLKEKINVQK